MISQTSSPKPIWPALALITAVFFFIGLIFLPRAGLEMDEVLFISGLFHPAQAFFAIPIFHHPVPMMEMTYLGATKAWLFAPVLRFAAANPYSIRLPTLILAAASVYLLGLIAYRIAGARAGIIAAAMIVTDLNFILTSTFDWGPVVIQNFLLLSGLYLFFFKREHLPALSLACFLFGLALWDKALFVWTLSGLVVAGVLIGAPVVWRELTWQRLVVGVPSFFAGALPLLIFNLRNQVSTFASNTKMSFADVPAKFFWLKLAFDGQSVGDLFTNSTLPRSVVPHSAALSVLYSIADRFPHPSSGRALPFLAILIVGPIVARPAVRRWILWFELAVAIAWLQAAANKITGQAIHHIVLFYPVAFLALGLSMGEVFFRIGRWGRPAYVLVTALLCASGLVVINDQFVAFLRFSPSSMWTDADAALARSVSEAKGPLVTTDWGISTTLDARTKGMHDIQEACFQVAGHGVTAPELAIWQHESALLIQHAPDRSIFSGQRETLSSQVAAAGFALEPLEVVSDTGGHPMFEVDRLKGPAQQK